MTEEEARILLHLFFLWPRFLCESVDLGHAS